MLRGSPYPCPEADRERAHEARPQGQGQVLRIPEGLPLKSNAFVLGFQVLALATLTFKSPVFIALCSFRDVLS